jgi:hypothetical protein
MSSPYMQKDVQQAANIIISKGKVRTVRLVMKIAMPVFTIYVTMILSLTSLALQINYLHFIESSPPFIA